MKEKGHAWQRLVTQGSIPQGVILGLYLGRMAAETTATPWRWRLLLLLALGGVLLGLALTGLLRGILRRLTSGHPSMRVHTWPLLLLLGYLAYPRPAPRLAAGLGFVVLLTLLLCHRPPQRQSFTFPRRMPLLESGVLIGALAFYLHTLAPDVLPADSGEFQLVATVLGIAHPPGYALYTMLGKLFTLLPLGNPAYRVNLLGAVCGALTLAVIAQSVRRATGSASAALLAAAALGLSATFWVQSTTANIRSLTALLTALCLERLLCWGETQRPRDLTLFGLCFGLGIGHHSSLALLALPFGLYILVTSPRLVLQPRRWVGAVGALLLTLLAWLYLPIRSAMGAPFDPQPIRSLAGFLDHVLARGFRGDMFRYRTLAEILPRLGVWAQIIQLQFGGALAGALFLAALPLLRRRKRALLLLLGTWLVNTVAAVTYRAPQTVEYLIPSYVALATLLGLGVGYIAAESRGAAPTTRFSTWRRPLEALLLSGLALLIVRNGLANYGSLKILHHDRSAREYAAPILEDAPPNALILSNWHRATVFWYLQQVEELRPDVTVRYVYPEGSLPNEEVWLRQIAAAIAERPVLVTNRYYAYAHTDYRWVPLHDAWLVRREPLDEPSERITTREETWGDEIRLLGYRLDRETLAPGETLSLRVYWQPLKPLQDLSSFIQLLGPEGVIGQGDLAQQASHYRRGEVRVDAYRFPLLPHATSGEYQLIAGFYRSTATGWSRLLTTDGADHVLLTEVHLRAAKAPMMTRHPLEIPFANGLRLMGMDSDRSVVGQTRLYLHWHRFPAAPLPWELWRGPESTAITVQALHEGALLAQRALPALAPGASATLALDLPASPERISLRLLAPDGAVIPAMRPWYRPRDRDLALALPQGPAIYVPLGGEMVYLGLAGPPAEARVGQQVTLRPRFLTLRPLLADDSVSLGLRREELGWEIKSDGTPARGMIPTLKWLRGWMVEDARDLHIPLDAPQGNAQVTLALYEAFTLHPLHVLDERLVREGQGTYLLAGEITIRGGETAAGSP